GQCITVARQPMPRSWFGLHTQGETMKFLRNLVSHPATRLSARGQSRRRQVSTLAAACLLGTLSVGAQAQSYPTRPITMVVGFAPGGGSDSVARLVASALTTKLGQPVVVENKPGANTILATQQVGKMPADGYSLLFTSASFAINPSIA